MRAVRCCVPLFSAAAASKRTRALSCREILEKYDSNKLFEAYGFGAKAPRPTQPCLPPDTGGRVSFLFRRVRGAQRACRSLCAQLPSGAVSHCFALNGNASNPSVEGVQVPPMLSPPPSHPAG